MSMVLEDYRQLSGITAQMREAAAEGEWDRLVELEQSCRRKVEELKPRDGVPADPDERRQKVALIKQMLADDADIRSRTEVWMQQLQRIMQGTQSEKRLQDTYLANY